MLEQGFVLFALLGVSYAAYLDLKTSEVPDWVSLAVAGGALLYYGYRSLATASFDPLIASLVSGTALFALGWGMYILGMWGGADALVLGAVGYAFPDLSALGAAYLPPWPAPVSIVLTVFVVGAAYSVVYALYTAARSDGFLEKMSEELEERRRGYSRLVILYTAVAAAGTLAAYTVFRPPIALVLRNLAASILLLGLLLGLLVFLRTVESRVMEKEIPVSELEAGDVLAEEVELETARKDKAEYATDRFLEGARSLLPFKVPELRAGPGRIAGLTPEQVEEIDRKREKVKVRTGVEFVPSFPAAILVLLLFGDPIYFILLQII